MRKLSTEIKKYKSCTKEILDFMEKKGYTSGGVSEFSAITGIPIYIIFYRIWKDFDIDDAEIRMIKLLKFYQIENDL